MKTIARLRKGHFLNRGAVFLLVVSLIAGMAACTGSGGGTVPDPVVEISDWTGLNAIRNDLNGSYKLMNDLHSHTDGYGDWASQTAHKGKGWQPIGTSAVPFTGVFDGNDYEIRDLVINRGDEDDVGLFGYVQRGLVKDIGLVSVNVTGKKHVGALVGYNWKGTLDSDTRPPSSKTYSDGSVTGEESVGGLVGNNFDGTVNQCQSSAAVFHVSSTPNGQRWRAGGLVGLNSGAVLNCDYNGAVTGDRQVGGLVGLNERLLGGIVGRVESCGGKYTVEGSWLVGGLAGQNLGTLRWNSYSGHVNGILIGGGFTTLNEVAPGAGYSSDAVPQGSYVGGVVGLNEGIVEECSAAATVIGAYNVGGLAGANTNEGTLENCSSDGDVTGIYNVGGLLGLNEGVVNNSLSGGTVTGQDNVGLLVGYNTDTGIVSNSESAATATRDGEVVDDLVGRDDTAIALYDLTISSTAGGSVTTPGEGTFTYNEGTVVSLVATAASGYRFLNWTGDVGTIADINAPSTTITIDRRYSVTANFASEAPPAAAQITFAVAGPMTFTQGLDHWAGAEMARDEINAAGGVNVGGARHEVALVKVDTDEILDASGVSGTTALTAVINDVDFVVGGFRTESVLVYREVAMNAKKIMMNCGAATTTLQTSVVTDYDRYKYWFKVSPYNEVFLVTSTMRYTGLVHTQLRLALGLPAAFTGGAGDYKLKFAILMEDDEWSNLLEAPVIATLTDFGLEHVGTYKCEIGASDLSTQLTAIASEDPHIVFTLLQPLGKVYGAQQPTYLPRVFSLGINTRAQEIDYHADTGASYHMTLDTWAPGLEITPTTLPWLNAFVAKTGRHPSFTALTYDAIHGIAEAIEAVSAANRWDSIANVIAPANIDELIQYLEMTPRSGVGAYTAYYPMPALDLGGGIYALSLDQVLGLYPHVQELINKGVYSYSPADWTTASGHIAHDIAYGPGYATGIAVQWQQVGGTWKKVGVWPTNLGPALDAALTDRYGNWNFAYPGTQTFEVPHEWTAAWLTSPP